MICANRILPTERFGLAEGPAWDDRAGLLYWVDIKAPALHSYDPETQAFQTWKWSETVSCCGFAETGEVLVGGRSGLWLFKPNNGERSLLYPIPTLAEPMRTNDGKVGPDGAFWISTMLDTSDRGPDGVVFRIAPDGKVRKMLEGITTANGMEWSRDGRTFFLADTRELWVDAWSYDPETIELSDRTRFITLESGKPDGAAVDSNGGYWVAGIYSGAIHHYDAEGTLIESISVPAEMVTMPCFGGSDLKTLFITSLSRGPDGVHDDGGLFAVQVDVAGPTPRRMRIEH